MNGIRLNHDSQPKWIGCWASPVNNADSIMNVSEMGRSVKIENLNIPVK